MEQPPYFALSARMYHMLHMFAEEMKSGEYMKVEEAQHYDQRPFRSMLIRGWVHYVVGRGFHITEQGREAWRTYLAQEITRSEALYTKPLTSYFDPDTYGLRVVPRKKKSAA